MQRLTALVGLLVCASAWSQAPVPSKPIPLEHFTRFDEFGTVKISPDGASLAVLTGKYGRSALVFIDREHKKITGGVRTNDNMEFEEFHWISPERVVYSVAEHQPGRATPMGTGEIFAVDRDGKLDRQLFGYRAGEQSTGTHIRVREASYATGELLSVLKHDPDHILVTERPWRREGNHLYETPDAKPRVVQLHVVTGKKQQLDTAPLAGAQLLVDRNEQVRFALGRNEQQKLAVSWKPQADSPWTAFDLPGFREESLQPQRFSPDNRAVYFLGVRGGETFAALYRLNLESHAVERVAGFENADVDAVITDLADREIIGISGYTERPILQWLAPDDRAAKIIQALGRAFPQQSVAITSATDDGRLAIVYVSSDTNPGDYYLFDTTAMKAEFLRATRVWIEPKQMRPKESIEIAARDGLRLHGYLTQPADAGPHPLVVIPHGGPHYVRDNWEFDSEVQLFVSRGYSVLQVNYRGSGGYGMDFQAAGYHEWGGRMQDDITDATRWAIEQRGVPADRICIYGASYGGYAALMGAVREPKLYKCAIGYAGVYDLDLMLSSGDIPRSRSGRSYLDLALGNDVAALRTRSPAFNAQRIEIPVLLIHGTEDWRADYEQAKHMNTALQEQHKQVELLPLRGEGHGAYDEATRREVYERILAFLDRNLKGAKTP